MAIVDATRELEPREARSRSAGTAARSTRCSPSPSACSRETGRYAGLDRRARAQGRRPDRLREALQRACAAASSPRARRRSTSRPRPIVRELGELCFALYTPEGDSIALSTGIIVHVHTMSDAIKYMIRHGYEDNPGITPGDIFANNDPTIGDVHNADVQTFVPIFWEERADRLGRRRHPRARHRRVDAGRGAGRPDQPPRRRASTCPCMKIGEDDELARWHLRAVREADPRADVLPARRAHPARRLPHGPRGGRAGDPRGGHRPLQAVQPRGDRGGPALVQGARSAR